MLAVSYHHPAQVLPEAWVGYGYAVRILDLDAIAGGGGENTERHCDAVITPRIDHARQLLAPGPHTQTIGQLVDLGSNRAEILDDGGNAIALLNPQLGCAADFEFDASAGGDASNQR